MLREFVLQKELKMCLMSKTVSWWSLVDIGWYRDWLSRAVTVLSHFLGHSNLLYELVAHTFTLLMQRMSH